jgi:hypothetical protein
MNPSRLLAYYAPTPNLQDDFDWITSEAKSTTETTADFYDRSPTSCRYALAGVAYLRIFNVSWCDWGVR